MTTPQDLWVTSLGNEPCESCGTRPSRSVGHGRFTCKKCYDAWWCPKCTYQLGKNHVCVTPEQHAKIQEEYREFFAEMEMDYPEE